MESRVWPVVSRVRTLAGLETCVIWEQAFPEIEREKAEED